jgi:hypothetical protein
VQNIMFLGLGLPGPMQRENGEFSNCPFGLFQPLLGLLHKSYSDSAPFQEALGVLRVSHSDEEIMHAQVSCWTADITSLLLLLIFLVCSK